MVGGRQAWCPRCDEVRRARPGSACTTCSARLVRLPQLSGAAPWLAGRAALLQEARSLLPALRAVAAGAVVLALLAGAFVAGRSSSPASAAPAAPVTTSPPSLTMPGGRVLPGRVRDFGWHAVHGRVSLLLRTLFVSGQTSSITFEAVGLDRGWSVEAVGDLHILDGQGQELGVRKLAQDLPVFRSRAPADGITVITLSLQRHVDPDAVAQVRVGRLVLAQQPEEHLRGTLVDADLKRSVDRSQPGRPDAASPASCPSCRVELRCDACQTIRAAGAAYRHGQVTLLLTPAGRVGEQSLGHADIVVSGASGQIGSLDTTIEGGDTVVTFDGRELAATTDRGQARMAFEVTAILNQMRIVQGPWQLDQRSGSR
jgi:hypothetical protein